MADLDRFRDLAPKGTQISYTADHVTSGIPVPKTKRIQLFSPNDWEEFTEEWATSLKTEYHRVRRFGGPGDTGLDVVGFVSDDTFQGGWDNYQCKHYDQPLRPSDIWLEIGKAIYYSAQGERPAPRKYYFVCPKGVGTALAKLLAEPQRLKSETQTNWAQYCQNGISAVTATPLTGTLLSCFEGWDFGMFSSRSPAELVDGHSTTPFHAVRFGGGLPARPAVDKPPAQVVQSESRYIQQIWEAYSHHTGQSIKDQSALASWPRLKDDFSLQRERFYHAESLRNFARDIVPAGTFDALQDDVFHGVVDVCQSAHADGLARMRATLSQSAQLSITSNPLSGVLTIKDKQGLCHQLANADKLTWIRG